jgi:hypothetical protein
VKRISLKKRNRGGVDRRGHRRRRRCSCGRGSRGKAGQSERRRFREPEAGHRRYRRRRRSAARRGDRVGGGQPPHHRLSQAVDRAAVPTSRPPWWSASEDTGSLELEPSSDVQPPIRASPSEMSPRPLRSGTRTE